MSKETRVPELDNLDMPLAEMQRLVERLLVLYGPRARVRAHVVVNGEIMGFVLPEQKPVWPFPTGRRE